MSIKTPALDLAHLIGAMTADTVGPREADLVKAWGGECSEPHRARIGWRSLVKRDLTVAGAPALVESDTRPAAAALRPASVAVASGATVLEGLRANVVVPKTSGKVSTYWLASESAGITESQPTVGMVSLSPKTAGAFTQFSRQLSLQGVQFSQFVESELRAAAAQAVDLAVLDGTGSDNQPTGVLRTGGIGTTTGSGVGYSTLLGAVETILAAGGSEAGMGWVMAPSVATLLRGRVRITGADLAILGDDNRICGYPCRVSHNVPAATILLCDWSKVVVGLWGSGIDVATDPFTAFAQGVIGARVLVSVDCAVTYPSAVYSITSVS